MRLKIAVSVVRFRPWAPIVSITYADFLTFQISAGTTIGATIAGFRRAVEFDALPRRVKENGEMPIFEFRQTPNRIPPAETEY